MRNETNREPHFFTAGEWVNKKEICLSEWPINKKALSVGRLNAGGTHKCLGLIRRLEAEGRL